MIPMQFSRSSINKVKDICIKTEPYWEKRSKQIMAKNSDEASKRRRPPAKTPEAREKQMIALAIDEAERLMLEHRAPASIINHYLKLASSKDELEREKLRKENELLAAKTEAIKEGARLEELYADAMDAMKMYRGED